MRKFMRTEGFVEWCIEDEDFEDDYIQKRTLYIDFITVHIKGQGDGKKLLGKFIKSVKKKYNLKAITLIASNEFGTDLNVLRSYYESFNFKPVHETEFGIEYQLDI